MNYALAVTRLGASADIVGCVGNDVLGDELLQALKNEKVGVHFVARHSSKATGIIGIIIAEAYREKPGYVGFPSASVELTDNDIQLASNAITEDTIVIVNYELPQARVATALKVAKGKGATTILNPAPTRKLDSDIKYWPLVDYLIPNIAEAGSIIDEADLDLNALSKKLINLGAGAVCITLGGDGCLFLSKNERFEVKSFVLNSIVDTVGASDAFCGAFAIGLLEKMQREQLLKFANAAGAIACLKSGGFPSMPFREQVDKLLLS